jgi:soluble epoxide hydrolase / lipid-phosphate phosphatase
MALAFFALSYVPPSPTFNLSNALVMTKKMFGYELMGYWHFLAEDGADKIIESHVRPPLASARTR